MPKKEYSTSTSPNKQLAIVFSYNTRRYFANDIIKYIKSEQCS